MNIVSVYSTNSNVDEAVIDLKNQIGSFDTKLLLYFASSNYSQEELSIKMKDAFKSSDIIGCSTSGEIVSGKMLKNSIVAMAFNSNIVEDLSVGVIEDIKNSENVKKIFDSFENHYGRKMSELEYNKYVGFILMDGLSGSEEKVMDEIGGLTNIHFIGGSAGDDLKFKETFVYANGKTYKNAAVLALLKPKGEFDFIKTQSFNCLTPKFVATKVDEAKREIIEFNNKPATEAYAESLGIKKEDAANKFMTNPVGIVIDENSNDVFVRSPQQIKDNSIIFYCNVVEGTEVSLLESTNIVEDTKKALEDKIKEFGPISGIINFNCILRTLELEQKNQTEAYGEIFKDIPTIGFSTYGEAFLAHINQTSTILIFK